MNRIGLRILTVLLSVLVISCSKRSVGVDDVNGPHELTIFFVNDMHGQLDNFAKVKHIVNKASEATNVLLVSGGDIFSGNPIVDQHAEKGFPIIDVMNRTGFDISVLGNHEFDYGIDVLQKRMQQAEFEWVCANVITEGTVLGQPEGFKTLTVGDLKVTFVGLVETNGKPDDVIPSTHPWRVQELEFQRFQDVAGSYSTLKNSEKADLIIALTHLGLQSDKELANDFSFFDLIIGGHTNNLSTTEENGIPTLMAGNKLSHLGRVDLRVADRKVQSYSAELIDLSDYDEFDADLMAVVNEYNDAPEFDEVLGETQTHHDRTEVGCFYTTALLEYMNVDISMQNPGGVRADLDQGPITTLEIYNIDPFNNGSVVYTWTAREIKDFFIQTGARLHVSGMSLERDEQDIKMYDLSGNLVSDETMLKIGINDYIPSVYDAYFPLEEADIKDLSTAETIIQYLKTIDNTVDFEGCNQIFKF